ncbi:MAG: ribbon-helix-helix protein, CopG family, partial [Chloroflexi bacterium]|nr:ribbon-helix-helix protein, CopG family [Chloroflexota bacterium]
MKKTAVYLPQDLYHELAQRAAREGTSVEELVRFALAQTYGGPTTTGAQSLAPQSSPPFPSGK